MYYKFLLDGHRAPLGRGSYKPGQWRHVKGDLIPCENAIHACRREDCLQWLSGPELWTFEFRGTPPQVDENIKVFGRSGRILERLEGWNPENGTLFMADCLDFITTELCRKDRASVEPIIIALRRMAAGLTTRLECQELYFYGPQRFRSRPYYATATVSPHCEWWDQAAHMVASFRYISGPSVEARAWAYAQKRFEELVGIKEEA